MPRLLLFVLLCLFVDAVSAQENNYVSGKVTDATGKPIASCSVYLSNTSIGDVTSSTGSFTLKNLPSGKYELVVSAIGYNTKVMSVSSEAYPHDLKISLVIHSTELSEVVVQPSDPNGWRKWGTYFIENFIGKTSNARQCRIINHKEIRFRFSDKNNRLTARANEPLIIENRALGYTVKFQLAEFSGDFNSLFVMYIGYPFFQEMNGDVKKKKQWIKKRKEAYYGSLMHFMRAAYQEKLADEGYLLLKNDSSFTSLEPLMKNNSNKSKSLFFTGKMDVVYHRIVNRRAEQSLIYLETPQPIEIQENGSYYSPKELVILDHWGQHEKLSNMLPFDYTP